MSQQFVSQYSTEIPQNYGIPQINVQPQITTTFTPVSVGVKIKPSVEGTPDFEALNKRRIAVEKDAIAGKNVGMFRRYLVKDNPEGFKFTNSSVDIVKILDSSKKTKQKLADIYKDVDGKTEIVTDFSDDTSVVSEIFNPTHNFCSTPQILATVYTESIKNYVNTKILENISTGKSLETAGYKLEFARLGSEFVDNILAFRSKQAIDAGLMPVSKITSVYSKLVTIEDDMRTINFKSLYSLPRNEQGIVDIKGQDYQDLYTTVLNVLLKNSYNSEYAPYLKAVYNVADTSPGSRSSSSSNEKIDEIKKNITIFRDYLVLAGDKPPIIYKPSMAAPKDTKDSENNIKRQLYIAKSRESSVYGILKTIDTLSTLFAGIHDINQNDKMKFIKDKITRSYIYTVDNYSANGKVGTVDTYDFISDSILDNFDKLPSTHSFAIYHDVVGNEGIPLVYPVVFSTQITISANADTVMKDEDKFKRQISFFKSLHDLYDFIETLKQDPERLAEEKLYFPIEVYSQFIRDIFIYITKFTYHYYNYLVNKNSSSPTGNVLNEREKQALQSLAYMYTSIINVSPLASLFTTVRTV